MEIAADAGLQRVAYEILLRREGLSLLRIADMLFQKRLNALNGKILVHGSAPGRGKRIQLRRQKLPRLLRDRKVVFLHKAAIARFQRQIALLLRIVRPVQALHPIARFGGRLKDRGKDRRPAAAAAREHAALRKAQERQL